MVSIIEILWLYWSLSRLKKKDKNIRFHNRNIMALLKPSSLLSKNSNIFSFHNRNIMALLKQFRNSRWFIIYIFMVSIIEILWLYWSWLPTIGGIATTKIVSIIEILWLYWSTRLNQDLYGYAAAVSIIEILWLYWSLLSILDATPVVPGFHNRNIMALLKQRPRSEGLISLSNGFHNRNIMAILRLR